MEVKYESYAYSAYVKNGKVNYQVEYYYQNRIVFIKKISEKQYVKFISDNFKN